MHCGNFRNFNGITNRIMIEDKHEDFKNTFVNENESAAYLQCVKGMNIMQCKDQVPSLLLYNNILRI